MNEGVCITESRGFLIPHHPDTWSRRVRHRTARDYHPRFVSFRTARSRSQENRKLGAFVDEKRAEKEARRQEQQEEKRNKVVNRMKAEKEDVSASPVFVFAPGSGKMYSYLRRFSFDPTKQSTNQ